MKNWNISQTNFHLAKGFNIMTNVTFGFIMFLISIAIFTAILVGGAALFSGHVALAILLACMFGMGIGVSIIERD